MMFQMPSCTSSSLSDAAARRRGKDRTVQRFLNWPPAAESKVLHGSRTLTVAERESAERFAAADRRRADVMLAQYGVSRHERDVEHVRRAMLMLSGGYLGRLGYCVAATQNNYRDVLYWARHPDQAPQR